MQGALLVCCHRDEGRPGVEQPYEVHTDVRRVSPPGLLQKDQLFGQRRPSTVELLGPVDSGVPSVVQQKLPPGVVGPASRPVVERGFRRQGRQDISQPGPQLGSECLVRIGLAEIHRAGSVPTTGALTDRQIQIG